MGGASSLASSEIVDIDIKKGITMMMMSSQMSSKNEEEETST